MSRDRGRQGKAVYKYRLETMIQLRKKYQERFGRPMPSEVFMGVYKKVFRKQEPEKILR